MCEQDAPSTFEAYRHATPVEVELVAGDLLYLPAFWYHCVTGGEDLNMILAWWSDVHPNKRDDAPEGLPHDPTRRETAATAGRSIVRGIDLEGAP